MLDVRTHARRKTTRAHHAAWRRGDVAAFANPASANTFETTLRDIEPRCPRDGAANQAPARQYQPGDRRGILRSLHPNGPMPCSSATMPSSIGGVFNWSNLQPTTGCRRSIRGVHIPRDVLSYGWEHRSRKPTPSSPLGRMMQRTTISNLIPPFRPRPG
jgi:hypothetical protein